MRGDCFTVGALQAYNLSILDFKSLIMSIAADTEELIIYPYWILNAGVVNKKYVSTSLIIYPYWILNA